MQHQKYRHSSQKEKSEIQLLPKLSVQEFNFGDVEKPFRNRKNKQIKLRNKKWYIIMKSFLWFIE